MDTEMVSQIRKLHVSDEIKTNLIAMLERPDDVQVLHRLVEPKVHPPTPGMKRVIFLDTETTGVDTAGDEMVELGYVVVEFDTTGNLGNTIKVYNSLNEPVLPITNSHIHGITNDMVKDQKIDFKEVRADIEAANLIVAHNSNFDRKIIERYDKVFETIPWACTYQDIDWSRHGIASQKLSYIAYCCGFFFDAHRATVDVFAMIEIIRRLDVFKELVLAAMKNQYILSAAGSPFSKKDILKERGYKPLWIAGKFVCWYTNVSEELMNDEKNWLLKDGGCKHVPVKIISSLDRYSTREQF